MEGRKNTVLTTYCLFDVQKILAQYGQMGCGKICGKIGSEEKRWGITKKNTGRARSAMMQTGKYSNGRVFAINEPQIKTSRSYSRRANFGGRICQ